MSAKIRHTKSTSGRTHRLTVVVTHYEGNRSVFPDTKPRVESTVITKRYKTVPEFDDQVQGDLIRQYWAEGGTVKPIGRIPDSPRVDPDLDVEERENSRPTPRAIAEACYGALGEPETITPDQFIGAVMPAVRLEREK